MSSRSDPHVYAAESLPIEQPDNHDQSSPNTSPPLPKHSSSSPPPSPSPPPLPPPSPPPSPPPPPSSASPPPPPPPPSPPPPPPPPASSSSSFSSSTLDLEIGGGGSSEIDYGARANLLRAAVLGANDGLVSVASLMIGVGAVNQTAKAMVISGLEGLVAGACSMAIGEFVSVFTQYNIQKAQMEREEKKYGDDDLPSPFQAAGASALAFSVGGLLPLLAGGFIGSWGLRVAVVCGVTSLGLGGFGAAGAVLGGSSVKKSAIRVMIGGWLAMLVTYGVLRQFSLAFKMQI